MDCSAPYVGDGPCCSSHRKSSFTPTLLEGQAQSQAKQDATQVYFESDVVVSRYLSMHYGPQDQVFSLLGLVQGSSLGSMARLGEPPLKKGVDELAAWVKRGREASPLAPAEGLRALDLGCAVGRGSFELASCITGPPSSPSPLFSEVVGVDVSARFIEVALRLKERHQMDYDYRVEGEIYDRATAALPAFSALPGGWERACQRTRFVRGDGCSLSSLGLGDFDAVLASELLESVPEPFALMKEIHAAMNEGGVLLLSSTFAWNERFSARDNWIGGTRKDGEPERSEAALRRVIEEVGFECLAEESATPSLVPVDSRSFELKILYTMVLKKIKCDSK